MVSVRDGITGLNPTTSANCISGKMVVSRTGAFNSRSISFLLFCILAVQLVSSNYSVLTLVPDMSVSASTGTVSSDQQEPTLITLIYDSIPTTSYYPTLISFQNTYSTSAVASPIINNPPMAYPEVVSTTRNTPVLVTLRATDHDGDPLTFFPTMLSTKTAHGKLGTVIDYGTSSAVTTARVTYYPDPGYTGSDSFAYQAVDTSNSVSNVAIINLIISG